MQIAAIIFIVLGTLTIVAIFARSRGREGIRPFEVTDKDRAQFQELRRELGFRRVLGRLLGTFGGLLIVGAICSPFYRDSSFEAAWYTIVLMMALGLFLVLCAVPLVRHSR